MSTSKTCLIVGAGPTGLTLARILAPYARVIVVDRVTPNYPAVRTLALTYDNIQFLESVGVTINGTPLHRILIRREGGVQTSFSAAEAKKPFLGNNIIVQALHDRLLHHPEVEYRLDYPQALTKNNEIWEYGDIQADYVFVTSGVLGPLSEILGVAVFEEATTQKAYIQPVNVHHPIAYQVFGQDTWAYLPTPFGGQIVATGNLSSIDFEKKWPHIFAELGETKALQSYATYPISLRTTDKQAGSNWAIFGSCAHHFSPVAAQGLNLTLRDLKIFSQILQKRSIKEALRQYALLAPFHQKKTLDMMHTLVHRPHNVLADVGLDAILRFLPYTGFLSRLAGV